MVVLGPIALADTADGATSRFLETQMRFAATLVRVTSYSGSAASLGAMLTVTARADLRLAASSSPSAKPGVRLQPSRRRRRDDERAASRLSFSVARHAVRRAAVRDIPVPGLGENDADRPSWSASGGATAHRCAIC